MGNKILIFGNSGSGKSTLATRLAAADNLAHLDLDVLAWKPTLPPEREALSVSGEKIDVFVQQNDSWVIEGCYTDLLQWAAPFADEIIYLNLPVALCTANAQNRPWESHKYASKAEQDKNLPMLLRWIEEYESRDDVFSAKAHRRFYQQFQGKKSMITENRPWI